jgi:hypothetical protein
MIIVPYQILLVWRIKEDEMDGECGTYGEEHKKTGFCGGGGPGYADISLDGRIILKPVLKN